MEEIYIARVNAITDVSEFCTIKTSHNLGAFLVTPIYKTNILGNAKKDFKGRYKIVGFKEMITGKKIIKRLNGMYEYSDHMDIDSESSVFGFKKGDLNWQVVEEKTAAKILQQKDMESYMSLSEEQVEEVFFQIREKARNLAYPDEINNISNGKRHR